MPRVTSPAVEAVRPPMLESVQTRLREGFSTRRRPSVESMITFGVIAAAIIFTFVQLQPSLIFAHTTPAGGDTGSHVWGPAFMRDHLLPKLRITGWAPDWYSGFPAYEFYFPLPAFVIAILSYVLPYGIAFKLVTVAGVLTLPIAAWAFGKLSGMRFPGPALLGIATIPFLFDRGFTIYGGNIASTLAGEFAFSISLSFALVFLGVVARGLDTGKHRGLAAVLLALTGLSHLLPTVFAVVGALILYLLRPGRRRLAFTATILGVGGMVAAFWSVPFLFRLPYANNMGWEKITEYSKNLFPHNLRWLVFLALGGAIASVVNRRRTGLFLVGMATISGILFVTAPQGRLWNARVLPFWYLCLYLLGGVAVAEAGPALGRWIAADPDNPSPLGRLLTPVAAAFAAWMFVGLPLGVLPGWLPKPATTDVSFIPSWAKWNYSGYERKAAYPEYKSIIDTMGDVGRTYGCGRAHWEYESGLDRFGTPMALMLLPYWTDGCIGSMEGLYFESSATVPYHFLSAAELSNAPSNPMRDLPYPTLNVADGVKHLQLLGAKYYMAFSPETLAEARVNPDLTAIATIPKQPAVSGSQEWTVFEIRGSELVTPLQNEPAVVTGPVSGEQPWMNMSVDWYQEFNDQDVFLAASGPKEWQRVAVHTQKTSLKTVGAGVTVDPVQRKPVTPAKVTNIKSDDDDISFDVDRVGSPVLVKASYFPNWKVSGAKGVYRVTPNMMVVIPTSTHVKLHYGYTPVDGLGYALTLGGIAVAVAFARSGPVGFGDPERDAEDRPPAEPVIADGGAAPAAAPPARPPVTVLDRGS
ncbi:MAG: 6-pyruvoyl-tetrahydropterin synthase-related protein [Actinomycetota bacterium]|nr:6-pyruvoyl-tetrahydropterin synthase-related protein [Actinomycetota bacterium]